MDSLLLLSLCIVPSLILLWYVYIKDTIEKEPLYLLTILFVGGIISCLISIIISNISKRYITFLNLSYNNLTVAQIIFKILIAIALVEESSKWIINYITIWKNKNFKHIYDPIVYSTFISLGFATFENVIYGISFKSYGIVPIIMRGLISVPSHAVFGIFMGYYLGIAKNAIMYHKRKKSYKYRILSLVVPIALHFIYDLLLVNKNIIMYSFFIMYIIVCYIFANIKIKKISSINKNLKEKNIS